MGDRASVHHLRHVRSHVGGDPFSFLFFVFTRVGRITDKQAR